MASIEARRPLKDTGLSSVWVFGIAGRPPCTDCAQHRVSEVRARALMEYSHYLTAIPLLTGIERSGSSIGYFP